MQICIRVNDTLIWHLTPSILRAGIINQAVSVVVCKPKRILYDSPDPISATILDIAKLHIYYHYYNVINQVFLLDKVSLMMKDTNSLVFM